MFLFYFSLFSTRHPLFFFLSYNLPFFFNIFTIGLGCIWKGGSVFWLRPCSASVASFLSSPLSLRVPLLPRQYAFAPPIPPYLRFQGPSLWRDIGSAVHDINPLPIHLGVGH